VRVDLAQLPEPPEGQDRVHTAPNAVIVLDGATALASFISLVVGLLDRGADHDSDWQAV